MTRTSIAAATHEAAGRDPVLAHLVELVGPIAHSQSERSTLLGLLLRTATEE